MSFPEIYLYHLYSIVILNNFCHLVAHQHLTCAHYSLQQYFHNKISYCEIFCQEQEQEQVHEQEHEQEQDQEQESEQEQEQINIGRRVTR